MQKDKTAAIILSGGTSSRMNAHKALLEFSENENFLQRIINVYLQAGISDIVVVKNADITLPPNGMTAVSEKDDCENIGDNVKIIDNLFPEKGRIYSLQLGLAAQPNAQYCYIQNIDNPFVTARLITELHKHREKAGYVTPQYKEKGGHPILVSDSVMRGIKNVAAYSLTLRQVLTHYSRHRMQVEDGQCLININSPADYQNLVTTNTSCRG